MHPVKSLLLLSACATQLHVSGLYSTVAVGGEHVSIAGLTCHRDQTPQPYIAEWMDGTLLI